MTDRKLLELAANAADIRYFDIAEEGVVEYGANTASGFRYWNPLIDDGDALRLAVKLKLTPMMWDFGCDVTDFVGLSVAYEPWSACPYATTRRAIVRAAAEIGKGIQQSKLEDVPDDNYYKLQAEAAEIGKALA